MAATKINYENKMAGSLWTSTNANEVKQVVNEHADELDALQSSLNNTEANFNNAVLFSEQSLTEIQKGQARENIGVEAPLTVDINDLDSLNLDSLLYDGKRARYVVTNQTVKVGVLEMFSDDLKHVITQVLLTHNLLNESTGQLMSGHADGEIIHVYRSYNRTSPYLPNAKGTWTRWKRVTQRPEYLDHVGVVPFSGFVDNVTVQNYTTTSGTILGIYFDLTRKCFLAKISEGGLTIGSAATIKYFKSYDVESEEGYEPSTFGNIADDFTPWPLLTYKNMQDGMSYMWFYDSLIPLSDDGKVIEHTTSETSVSIAPNILHRWGDMETLTIAFSEGGSRRNEYMIEFSCGETPTALTLPSSVIWADELELEPDTIYQISIENNLAIGYGWPKPQTS